MFFFFLRFFAPSIRDFRPLFFFFFLIFDIRVAYTYSGDDTEFPRVIRRLVVGERPCWLLLFSRVKIRLPRPRAVLINSRGVNDVLLVFRAGERPLKSDGPVINRGYQPPPPLTVVFAKVRYRPRRRRSPTPRVPLSLRAAGRRICGLHVLCFTCVWWNYIYLFIHNIRIIVLRVCRHKHMTLAIGQRQLGDRYINRQENRFHRIRFYRVCTYLATLFRARIRDDSKTVRI